MNSLSVRSEHFLRSADGWLDLGDFLEANAELDRIDVALHSHPKVLNLRWRVYRLGKKWELCFRAAQAWVFIEPTNPEAWLRLAESLSLLGADVEAHALLMEKMETFPRCWTLYFDAARYACRLGRLAQAQTLLEFAMIYGHADTVRQTALRESDFAVLK